MKAAILVYFFLVMMFCCAPVSGFGQSKKVSNIFSRTIGDTIEIFYDLPRNADTLDVKVYFYKRSDPKTRYRLKKVSGSVGVGVFSGKKQKIAWDYKKEPSYLFTGSGFYYKVLAKKFQRKSF